MIKFFKKLKNPEAGATLIELVVAISIIVLFSLILISDFPKILRQAALSRATYKLAQDLRRVQDLGLSGVQVTYGSSAQLLPVHGYGIYFNSSTYPSQYIIYADVDGNNKYGGTTDCSSLPNTTPTVDCAIETIDITKENSDLYIEGIDGVSGNYTSINFTPPTPTISIDNIIGTGSEIGIVLGLKSDSSTRTVKINKSGLIQVQ